MIALCVWDAMLDQVEQWLFCWPMGKLFRFCPGVARRLWYGPLVPVTRFFRMRMIRRANFPPPLA
jgi:hypothetical protein